MTTTAKLDYTWTPDGLLRAQLGDYRARTTSDRSYHVDELQTEPEGSDGRPEEHIWVEIASGALEGEDSSTDLEEIRELLEHCHGGRSE